MIKKSGITVAMAVLLMAAMAIPAFAEGTDAGTYDQQVLQLRYESVSARVGFSTGVMADIVALVPQASDLNAHVARLNADLTTLGSYVAAGDPAGFGSFVSGTINPDMKAANDAMKADRALFREWNVSAETLQALRDDYNERKAAFDARIAGITVQLGNLRLSNYNAAVAKYDERMTKLSAKGVDVAEMQAIEAGAQANVIAPLQAAISSGDADSVKAELKGKCLGNGAPYSYHFWAKMDAAGGKAVTARIADNATQAGYGEQIGQINAELAAARSAIDAAGTNPYTIEQRDTIWDSLRKAAEQLRSVIAALGGH